MGSSPLFSPFLISPSPDPNFLWRPLQQDDYARGVVKLLSQLTEVGDLSKATFESRWREMANANNSLGPTYHIVVCEDVKSKTIVAIGTLFVERKFIRNAGLCGHIEDIVVDSAMRGKNLGLKVIEILKEIGQKVGCYKILLDCDQKNVPFYEKCGFKAKGAYMALYLPATLPAKL
eukprot:TRINITY_DN5648_c0_g4_i2.p1 TRINITY_DN5648_c0_g4~~TRINITY_DN5648_c0_g4_i2.p1  ORF type:complete len:176 (+),score=23.06 TRINITY_DN5648_c0_g4_i2:230-757(+)